MIIKPINQALSPGDIVGIAFNLMRHNIGFTCKVLLVPTIINALASIGMQWAITKPGEMTQSLAGMGFLALIGIAGIAVGLFAKWILTLRQMSLMRMAGSFSSTWEDSYKTVMNRKWQVVALWLLVAIVSVGLFVVWLLQFYFSVQNNTNIQSMAPAILFSMFALICALSVLCFATFMSLCLIACDKLTFKDTVDRTVSLIANNFLRCFAFSSAFILTILVMSYPLSMPIIILGIWDTYRLGIGHNPNEMPLHTVIAGHVWESFITLLISPLFSFAFATFYVDLLNRKEGLDLKRRLDVLKPIPESSGESLNDHGTQRS